MTVRIITDSVSDIPEAVAAELGITVVPLNVVFDAVTYRDGVDITTDEFYEILAKNRELPTTSTPSPQICAEFYDRLAKGADGILVITIGRKLSATSESALKAVGIMKGECRVEVIASELAMMAEGLIVIAAAKAASRGADLDELVKLTRRNVSRVGIRIAFDILEYLEKGGRIGKAQALMGSMLGINPVLGIKDGEVFPFARERSRAKAIDQLYNFAVSYSKIEEMAVEDATTPDETDAFVERLGAIYPKERIYRSKVSPVIGTNVGPRVVGVAVLGDK
ncbi:MAG: DegV family protein [Dehalococcoidales bacterium]|nr:DegV family protein [Dehalococcoidales bacterium]